MSTKAIDRLRRICAALPGAVEKLSHGEPTWFAGGKGKVFAMLDNRRHGAARVSVYVPAPAGTRPHARAVTSHVSLKDEEFFAHLSVSPPGALQGPQGAGRLRLVAPLRQVAGHVHRDVASDGVEEHRDAPADTKTG